MVRSPYAAEQHEAADKVRWQTLEQLHQQLADNIAHLDNREAWQEWLNLARSLHRYSFNNALLILVQMPEATAVAGYRAWQAQGHQVRRGERAIKVLGPVTVKAQVTDSRTGAVLLDANGQLRYERRMVGVRPVSVFDASQVEPAPPTPPVPALLAGEAPPGLWDSLAELVAIEGYQLSRGDCAWGQRAHRLRCPASAGPRRCRRCSSGQDPRSRTRARTHAARNHRSAKRSVLPRDP